MDIGKGINKDKDMGMAGACNMDRHRYGHGHGYGHVKWTVERKMFEIGYRFIPILDWSDSAIG